MLRDDGWSLVTMAEHYGERIAQTVSDTDWLQLAGENNWPVLAKDERIRYRPAELAALVRHGVRAFYLTSGNLTAELMAEAYIVNRGGDMGPLRKERSRPLRRDASICARDRRLRSVTTTGL